MSKAKEKIYLINDVDFGVGSIANDRESAIAWFGAFLDNLENNQEAVPVKIYRKDMTKKEFEALPEI
jgi:hypothetical protein